MGVCHFLSLLDCHIRNRNRALVDLDLGEARRDRLRHLRRRDLLRVERRVLLQRGEALHRGSGEGCLVWALLRLLVLFRDPFLSSLKMREPFGL